MDIMHFETDDMFKYQIDKTAGEVFIKKYIGNHADITIPEEYKGYPITGICPDAFFLIDIQSVSLSDNIKCIGMRAFANCHFLTKITLGKNLKQSMLAAFENCKSLKSIYIEDIDSWFKINFMDDTSNPMLYAKDLYVNGCITKNLKIPSYITDIYDYQLNANCFNKIKIGPQVKHIGNLAFGLSILNSPSKPLFICDKNSYAHSWAKTEPFCDLNIKKSKLTECLEKCQAEEVITL